MADIFNINSDQPQIESDSTDSKCPVCGYPIKDDTQICPNCHETIWQESEILDSDNESEQDEESPKDKEIKKYEAQYNRILAIIAVVIAVPLVWITYKEFSDQQWFKAVWFVLVVYLIISLFVGYLLKDTIHSLAKRKVGDKGRQWLKPRIIKILFRIIKYLFIVFWGLLWVYIGIKSNLYDTIYTKIQEFIQQKKPSLYAIELDKDIMIVTIPQFTVGIVGFNEIDWGELNIVEVVDEMYKALKANPPNSNVKIYISMYSDNEDRYGNKYRTYRLYDLMSVNTSEVKKYKNSNYFERDYDIIHQIRSLPFDKKPIKEIDINEKNN